MQTLAQNREKVAVTGASGFLGCALVKELRKSSRQIVAVSRRIARNEHEIRIDTIDDKTNWLEVVVGSDCIVHCAGHAHQTSSTRDVDAVFEINTRASINLTNQAAEHGVKRLIFISSVKALGEQSEPCDPFTSKSKEFPMDAYGSSKRLAELGLLEIAQRTGLEVVIIRPPLVYGPGVKANFRQLMSWVARGVPLPFADIHNLRSLVYLGNLVDLITVCIDHPNAPGNTFMVSDGHDLSTPDLIRQIAAAMGRSPRLFGMPEPWLRQAARLAGRLPQFERLTQNLQVDMAHTRSVLGWTPPYTVEQGMRETVRAFLHP